MHINKLISLVFAAAVALAACAQDLVTRYPDNYRGDGQYKVARALDPLMGSYGQSSSAELLRLEHLDAVGAIGDRGCFTLSSGVVATPAISSDGSLDLGARPRLSYDYSPLDEVDCFEMVRFIGERYAAFDPDEPFDPCMAMEEGGVDLPVPTGILRIEATPTSCAFVLLPPSEPAE